MEGEDWNALGKHPVSDVSARNCFIIVCVSTHNITV